MASSPRFFSFYSSLVRWFFTLVSNGFAADDALRLARHDECQQYSDDQGVTEHQAVPLATCFILDSGASLHASGDRSTFSTFIKAAASGSAAASYYQVRDGRQLTVAGAGNISCGNFHFSDVLYVPGLRAGVVLVSVQQLAELGYLAMFGGGQCSVKDPSSGEIVGKGQMHDDGLYHLEFLNVQPPDTTDDVTNTSAAVSK